MLTNCFSVITKVADVLFGASHRYIVNTMNSLDVVTFGEAMAMFVAKEVGDLSQVHDFIRRAVGAELNVAIGLTRLGFYQLITNMSWSSSPASVELRILTG